MGSTKHNHQGFGTVEALLVVVIVGILGFTGWFVIHAKHTSDKTLSANTSTVPTTQKSKTANTTTNTQATQQQSLNIPEWSVHVTLDSSTSSLYYSMPSNTPGVAYFGLKAIDSIAPDCAADKISLAAISRQTEAQQQADTRNPSDTSQPGTIHIGNYWYGIESSHAACANSDQDAQISQTLPNYSRDELLKVLDTISAN